jgi:hypothetical protein
LSTDEFDAELSELEIRLERLRSLYEQYFVGLEKIEPAVARKDVDRRFWELRKVKVRNTAKRFKFQTLIQRYNTLQQYWMKVCRQIENGTYVRHLARAKRRMGEAAGTTRPQIDRPEEGLDADDPTPAEVRAAFSDLARASLPPRSSRSASGVPARSRSRAPRANEPTLAASPAPALTSLHDRSGVVPPPRRQRAIPPTSTRTDPAAPNHRSALDAEAAQVAGPRAVSPPPGARPRPAEAAPASGRQGGRLPTAASQLSDARIDRLHAELESAQQQAGGEVVSRGALAKSLRQTEARLRAKHAGKNVDFRVDMQDGKPIIKPVIKR